MNKAYFSPPPWLFLSWICPSHHRNRQVFTDYTIYKNLKNSGCEIHQAGFETKRRSGSVHVSWVKSTSAQCDTVAIAMSQRRDYFLSRRSFVLLGNWIYYALISFFLEWCTLKRLSRCTKTPKLDNWGLVRDSWRRFIDRSKRRSCETYASFYFVLFHVYEMCLLHTTVVMTTPHPSMMDRNSASEGESMALIQR